MNILITGDTSYSNRIKIRKILTKLNKTRTVIATFNKQYGVDLIVLLLQLLLDKTTYCFKLYSLKYLQKCLQLKLKFDRNFHPVLYTHRNNDAIKWADLIIIFYRSLLDKLMQQLHNQANKADKTVFLIDLS